MKILTLNEGPKVGHPYANRDRYNRLVPVPNGNAGGAHERMLMALGEDGRISRAQKRTYMRSMIKREAAAMAMYPRILKDREREKRTKYQQTVILQMGASGKGTHELNGVLNLGIVACQGVAHMEQIVETIYLAVISARYVHTYQDQYQGQESPRARNRVDLPKEAIKVM